MADFNTVSREQAEANRLFALTNTGLNRVDTYSPSGSVTWSLRPGADPNNPQVGDYVQRVDLNPSEQAQFDARNALQEALLGTAQSRIGDIANTFGRPIDTSGLRSWGAPIATMNNPNAAASYSAVPGQQAMPPQAANSYSAVPTLRLPTQRFTGGTPGSAAGRGPNDPSMYRAPPPGSGTGAGPQLPFGTPYDRAGVDGGGVGDFSGQGGGAAAPGGGQGTGLSGNSVNGNQIGTVVGTLGNFFGLPGLGTLGNLTGVNSSVAHSINSAMNRGAVASEAPPGTPSSALSAMIDGTPFAGESTPGTATTGPNGTGGQAAAAGAAAAAAAAQAGHSDAAVGAAAQAAADATLAGADAASAAAAGADDAAGADSDPTGADPGGWGGGPGFGGDSGPGDADPSGADPGGFGGGFGGW